MFLVYKIVLSFNTLIRFDISNVVSSSLNIKPVSYSFFNDLYTALMKGITETGIDIISLGLCTTPMYYYACLKLKVYSVFYHLSKL